MTLRIEENYASGIPQTILPGGLRPLGIADHWTAGGTGRTGALSTIRHFQATGATVNASYHALVFWESPTLTCMWIVRSDRAAHSLAPGLAFVHSNRTADQGREKTRFIEVRRILGARAADPNAAIIALSFCGMPADLVHALADPECVRAYRELHYQIMRGQPTLSTRPLFGHGWIQPSTRYEMDSAPGGSDLLIAKMYGTTPPPPAPGGNDMIFRTPIVTQDWDTVVGPASTFTRPDGTTGYFSTKERVKSVAEGTIDGKDSRLLDYGTSHEALTIGRGGLTNPGPRIVGSPDVTTATKAGQTQGADAVLEAAKLAGKKFGAA